MEIVTKIEVLSVAVECPYCKKVVTGFFSDPRGYEVECDYCDQTFEIDPDADIEML